jgi:hypothetical protein
MYISITSGSQREGPICTALIQYILLLIMSKTVTFKIYKNAVVLDPSRFKMLYSFKLMSSFIYIYIYIPSILVRVVISCCVSEITMSIIMVCIRCGKRVFFVVLDIYLSFLRSLNM